MNGDEPIDEPVDEPFYGSMAAWTQAHMDDRATPAPAPERYALGGELGRGGMGVVQAATDIWLGRSIAVKRPHADLSPSLRDRLMREASITAQLVHPSIVPVYDVGQDEHGTYYTMPILVGQSLEQRLESGKDSVITLVRALARVVRAVAYAHSHEIVHRDLKPANILMGEFGEVWLLDWGVAQDSESSEGEYVGTLGYQSPEQTAGYLVDGRADVYSLGKVLRDILNNTTIPELDAIVRRAIQPAADERYASAEALASDLERWLDGRRVSVHAYTAPEVLRRFVRRYQAVLIVALLSALMVLMVVVIAFKNQAEERDRAVRAEQISEVARAQADENLSVALRQQAMSAAARGARSEAELLAVQSLALADSPEARGVLMAWQDTPRLQYASTSPLPCEHAFGGYGAELACTTEHEVSRYDHDGTLRWQTPAATPIRPDEQWVGDYRAGRLYPQGMLLLRSPHVLEVWKGDVRTAVNFDIPALRLVSGSVPAISDRQRIGKVDLQTGEITWTPKLCTDIESAFLSEEHMVVGCWDDFARVGTFDDPGPLEPTSGSPSKVTWVNGPIIGTFQGDLLTRDGDQWIATPSSVEGVSHLSPLPHGRVAVAGERGAAVIWSPNTRSVLATLPGLVRWVAAHDDSLHLFGEDTREFRVPKQLRPTRFDRSASGGLRFLSASPSGSSLFTASANEELLSWDVATGQATVVETSSHGIGAVSGAAFGEDLVIFSVAPGGVQTAHRTGGALSPLAPFTPRVIRSVGNGAAGLGHLGDLFLFDPEPRLISMPAPPVAITSAVPTWVADETGRVSRIEGDRLQAQFTLPQPSGDIASSRGRIIATQGADVVAFSLEGSELWRWTGDNRLTAMHANDDWVAIGDTEGWLTVLSTEGATLARAQAHKRLVSDVVVVGDVLFSGSWDGTARRWGLNAAIVDVEVASQEIRRAWGP